MKENEEIKVGKKYMLNGREVEVSSVQTNLVWYYVKGWVTESALGIAKFRQCAEAIE